MLRLGLNWTKLPATEVLPLKPPTMVCGNIGIHNLTCTEKLFEYYGKHPESSELFNKGLTANGSLWSLGDMLSKYYNFENCGSIIDIGGGEGSIVKRLLRTHPKLKGIVFDLVPFYSLRIILINLWF